MEKEIINKLDSLRQEYSFLAKKDNSYILNACVTQVLFYKNPSNILGENDLKNIIVDGTNDGGIDCILNDLDSDYNDMVFIQCKYYEKIDRDTIRDALSKMYLTYMNLLEKKFSNFKDDLISQYTDCNYEMEDGSLVKFVFCTTAPKNKIKEKEIQKNFKDLIGDYNIKLEILFEDDLIDKIIEFDSLRRTVSAGKIILDKAKNYLIYNEDESDLYDDAVIVNGSANSIKELYSKHHLALFSQNLRFFVSSKNIDKDIKKSISDYKRKFWYKNNGITIICDDYDISGKELKLKGFSIINGGQTTTLIGKNDLINEKNDFYLPIKIIKIQGDNDEDKQQFIFDIAIATNSQKAIKPADLKANEPEQVLFSNIMRQNGVFYKTKRGEVIPNDYKEKYKNCDLAKASKLGLAGIYLMPGTSRSRPSIIYDDKQPYYEGIFGKEKRDDSALTIKDLLFIDNYFDITFKKEFAGKTTKTTRITFANNSRTLCLSFAGFLSKYLNNKFKEDEIKKIVNADYKTENDIKEVHKIFINSPNVSGILNKRAYEDLDLLRSKLYEVFSFICKQGSIVYSNIDPKEKTNESNWLKSDTSFYKVIAETFDDLNEEIEKDHETYSIFKK